VGVGWGWGGSAVARQ